ncbi:hypothetical protein [Thiosocius teredinicola]|uniref:hypothetical protein n=1 Tax=Thiosocius teredinicola TaxID=1973002 RepID=UPI000F796942
MKIATYAESTVRSIWKAWFKYAMATVGIFGVLALITLVNKSWVSGELFAVLCAAVFAHHFWLFALERWLRKEGGVSKMGDVRALLFSANFYLGMLAAPVLLVVSYLVRSNA